MSVMRSRYAVGIAIAATLILAGSLSGCGGIAHPAVAAADTDAQARLASLIAKDQQVAAIAWRLAVSNADICPATHLRAGWTLQSASQYGPELRPLAEQAYGLQGDLPGILSAPLDSPAQKAGLRPGDLILAINEQPLRVGNSTHSETYEGLQTNIDRLNAASAEGAMSLTVRRDGLERRIVVTPRRACAYVTQVEVRDDLRALSDGRTIFISARLVDVAQNDDQLAFLLAHELAHAVLEHASVPDVRGGRGELNDHITLRRGLSSQSESDADTLGLYLLARASFDPERAVHFLTAYEAAAPGARYPQINLRGVYPSIPDRRRALEPVVTEISRRQDANLSLIP